MGIKLLLVASERGRDVHKVPLLDVIVLFSPAMNVSLNGVAFVADYESRLPVRPLEDRVSL